MSNVSGEGRMLLISMSDCSWPGRLMGGSAEGEDTTGVAGCVAIISGAVSTVVGLIDFHALDAAID